MNSHSPSLAITRMRSSLSGLNSYSTNSGSDDTPAVCATASHRERLMARPGTSMWPSQTRAGPSTPSSYSTANTRPPLASILAFSRGRSGLWSAVRATAVTPPVALRKAIEVRLSPMLHRVQWLSRMTAQVKVVPEKSVSTEASLRISPSHRATTSVRAAWMSHSKSLCLNRYCVKLALIPWDTLSPSSPCPSITTNSRERVLGSSAIINVSWFFFLGL
mmetsp:Transcript_21663/g.48248  ORF Transcript_21663/g.48248 Transcript_21663/m.48248 type:complete len:219 (-) Transcript_21663:362-1018(-)